MFADNDVARRLYHRLGYTTGMRVDLTLRSAADLCLGWERPHLRERPMMSTISNGSVNLHVDDSGGDGRPVVLIHGWPLTGESWSGAGAGPQEAGYRVVTYDRRGFGRSDKPGDGLRLRHPRRRPGTPCSASST